jgi:hypothetical protein
MRGEELGVEPSGVLGDDAVLDLATNHPTAAIRAAMSS